MIEPDPELIETLAHRECFRDEYRLRRDPIAEDRLAWRAQIFRHLTHLMPRQTILELGCGDGAFTRQLVRVSRGENPITALSFREASQPPRLPPSVEYLADANRIRALDTRQFDLIVGLDLLDSRSSASLLTWAHERLLPGGQVIFFESNPWNVMLRARRLIQSWFLQSQDPRGLLSRRQLNELMSEIGLIRIFTVYTDFVYAPLSARMAWLLRNLSIILENAPLVRTLAGAIIVHAQRPPRIVERPPISLCNHAALDDAVSIVVPCHNEQMNVEPLVNGLRGLYGDYLHQVVLVDDNSTDHTREVIERLASRDSRITPVIRTPPNGVGRALADGYHASTGRWIMSMDCDFQNLLPELRDMFEAAADGFDVVVGSRFSRHSVLLNYPVRKIIANRAFHLCARVLLRRRFRDLTNNLKLFRREILERMILTQPGFAVNAETGFEPLVMGAKVKEVPISWINRTPEMGASSFKLLKVGGGYGEVLGWLWLRCVFGAGPYRFRIDPGMRSTYGGDGSIAELSTAVEGTRN
ncbi:MAG TPA: glycosyltransferase [Candidatus Binataceae bacterium]